MVLYRGFLGNNILDKLFVFRYKRPSGAYIAGKSFVGNFEIKLSATSIYDLKIDNESGYLFFDLHEGKERKTKNEPDEE